MKNSTVRTVSIGIAAASAAVALGTAFMGSPAKRTAKRTAKKLAKKAINSVSGVMDSLM